MALKLTDSLNPSPSAVTALCVDELTIALDELYGHLKALVDIAKRKLQAMRTADAAELHECTAEEGRRLQMVFQKERDRDAILARLAQVVRGARPGRKRLSEIANELPEPHRSRITAKTRGLREIARELQDKNKIAAAVARGLHTHIRAVFSAVAKAGQEPVGYAEDGRQRQRGNAAWVDAVG